MESNVIDLPILLASLLILGILGLSVYLWIQQIRRRAPPFQETGGIAAWPIGWVNFAIFVCVLVTAIFVLQNLAATFFLSPITDSEGRRELTPWLAVFSVLLLQLPMLAVFYGLRHFYPAQFATRLNETPLTLGKAFRQASLDFVQYLPVVWLAALLWGGLLRLLESLERIDAPEPQALVRLFQAGGDPLAIGVLVVLAFVLAPIVEEIIFRGGLYRFLKSQTTLLPAQIISGALFALIHANTFSFMPLLVVGVLLARSYERSGNLLVPIAFHALFNGFSLLILFITSLSQTIPQ